MYGVCEPSLKLSSTTWNGADRVNPSLPQNWKPSGALISTGFDLASQT